MGTATQRLQSPFEQLGESIMRTSWILFFVFLFLVVPAALASDSTGIVSTNVPNATNALSTSECQQAYTTGNALYTQNKYQEALTAYEACSSTVADPWLHYNMGNAYYRLNKIGLAILHYEKALLYKPLQKDILHNLDMALLQTRDKAPKALNENPLLKTALSIHHFFTIQHTLWILLLLGLLAVLLGLFRILYKGEHSHRFLPFFALLFLLIFSFATSALYRIYSLENTTRGVIISPVAEVMSGPGSSFEVLHELHEGTRFVILQTTPEWHRIQIGEQIDGYIHAKNTGIIQ
jgi:hypothetical protein